MKVSGGGRESNPPGGSPRLTGFEDREGHQSPFASSARIVGGVDQVSLPRTRTRAR